MKSIENIYKGLLSIFNYPHIPKELLEKLKGPILLHISDTPVGIYDYIFRIIDILKPQYIIHTGDMADNIKLGNYKYKTDLYIKGVKRLIQELEKNEHSKNYYALGNHDDYEVVNKLSERGTILQENFLEIHNYKFVINHYYKKHFKEVDFYLYGHSFEPIHYKNNKTIGLNGVLNINIIDLSNGEVHHLDYPVGTNRLRLMEFRRVHL